MTERPPDDEWGRPQQPQPPQYGQPPYGQPQSGQPQYGQPQYGEPQYGQPAYGQPAYGQPDAGGQVRNYLVPSILATLFCCMPSGVAAIVFSAQANSKRQAGDIAGAIKASNSARTWLIVSIVLGLIVGIGYAIFVAGVIGTSSSQTY